MMCDGDDGAPLFYKVNNSKSKKEEHYFIGMAKSYTVHDSKCKISLCGCKKMSTIFTNLYPHAAWIQNVTNQHLIDVKRFNKHNAFKLIDCTPAGLSRKPILKLNIRTNSQAIRPLACFNFYLIGIIACNIIVLMVWSL